MNFIRTNIHDVVIIEPTVHYDERGYLSETFRQDQLEKFLGFKVNFCQDNESKSNYGVLRGLHYQSIPFPQTKLVRVLQGKVLDVAVDARKGSPTFGQHVAVELSSENRRQLFVPRGFAHGFVALSETATLAYKVDNYFKPQCDTGIAFDDPFLGIDWKLPAAELILSQKDKNQVPFLEVTHFDVNSYLYDEL